MHYFAKDLAVTVDERGYIASLTVLGQNALAAPSPLAATVKENSVCLPKAAAWTGDTCALTMADGGTVTLKIHAEPLFLRVEALSVPDDCDALLFGPLLAAPSEVVGEVIGVAQEGNIALGVMAQNRKTVEGVPLGCYPACDQLWSYLNEPANTSTGDLEPYRRAATRLRDGGTLMAFHCVNRTRETTGTVCGVDHMLIKPLPAGDPDAVIAGAGVLIYGCERSHALDRIGEIELAAGLPHPILSDGQWDKLSRRAMKSYLISDFTKDNVDMVLDKAALAGFDTIYHEDPFKTWGHFQWKDYLACDDADFISGIAQKVTARGMKLGLHTLSNFITPNDGYVTPIPSPQLVEMCRLTLLEPLTEGQTEALVTPHPCLSSPHALNAIRAGEEIFTYTSSADEKDCVRLIGLTRGAFGTAKTAHKAGEIITPLRDHGYKVFFPDIPLQDRLAERISQIFNATGAAQISFDGLEGCAHTGHDLYAMARFVSDIYSAFDHTVINDASRLHHYTWHMHTRMNWGEPWGEEMRAGQVQGRIRNQDFYHRNLFPRMLGWYLLRAADWRFEASTREDLEWALSKAAGFDAGYSMTIRTRAMRKLGNIDLLLALIRQWDSLRMANAFTEAQKSRLRQTEGEFRLERRDERHYTLYPLCITRKFTCVLSEMQPGQPGGADWLVDNTQGESFALRLKVEGEGKISNPMFVTRGGAIKFPCEVAEEQYLIYDLDGTARVTDRNFNLQREVTPIGSATLPHGESTVAFSCDCEGDDLPAVLVRFITKGEGEEITLPDA